MKYKRLLIVIIPLFYFTLGSYFHQVTGLYSLRSADPEYIYFMNGVTLANGKMKIGNIDHPGIPFDYLMAASLRTTHLFRSSNASFNEDVLAHPDEYLRVVNLALIMLIVIVTYGAGRIALSISPNIWYALIIQFTPFATEIVYGNLGRLTTENFISIPLILLSLLLLKFIENKEKTISWKDVFLLSAVIALSLSIKLTLAPLVLLPLIIIPSWKRRIFFVVSTLLVFLIISIPVTLQLDYFWRWIKGLFLFSGQYGQGKKNVVDTNTFFPNIVELININKQYFIFTVLFLITAILTILLKKVKTSIIHNKISIAIFLIVLFQVLALGKHFKTPYFIPALMLLPLMVILTIEYLKLWIPENFVKLSSPLYIVVVLGVFMFAQWPSVLNLSVHFEKQNADRMKAYYFFKNTEENAVKIIVPGFYGGPIQEYALMTSYQWAGRHKDFFKPYLAKLYPDSYIYYTWDQTLNYWGTELAPGDFSRPVYIYFQNPGLKEETMVNLSKYLPEHYVLHEEFFNKETNELVFRIRAEVPEI